MTYFPIVARLEAVTAIPGADRIVAATASGYRLVVAATHRVGELGVVFPAGGILDLRFAQAAGLLARDPDTGVKLTGYLDNPPVVRCLTLRGAPTDAMWMPVDAFARAVAACLPVKDCDAAVEVITKALADGDEVQPFNFEGPNGAAHLVVASKYEARTSTRAPRLPLTPEGRRLRDAASKVRKVSARVGAEIDAAMPRHYDTPAAHRGLFSVPVGWVIYATHKVHGTSGRTALRRLHLSRLQRAANLVAGLFGRRPFADTEVVAGTRERLVSPESTDYRAAIRDWLAPRMRPGECLYYEIVGYTNSGKPIQRHRADPKKGSDTAALAAKFGGLIDYSYGCEPDGAPICPGQPYPGRGATKRVGFFTVLVKPQQRVIVYRITQDGHELPLDAVRVRAMQIGVESPRVLAEWHHVTRLPDLYQLPEDEREAAAPRLAVTNSMRLARLAAEGPDGAGVLQDPLDSRHPLEGVVLRCQPHTGAAEHRAFKMHSHGFQMLQGRSTDRARAGDKEVVDVEEQEQEAAS